MAAWHTNGVTGPHLQTLERQHTTMIFKGWLQFISCVKALLSVMFALCVIFSQSIFVLQCFFLLYFLHILQWQLERRCGDASRQKKMWNRRGWETGLTCCFQTLLMHPRFQKSQSGLPCLFGSGAAPQLRLCLGFGRVALASTIDLWT